MARKLAKRIVNRVCQGKVFRKSKKPHHITGMVLSDRYSDGNGQLFHDDGEWADEICALFSNKWGSKHLQDRINILDAVLQQDGAGIKVSANQLLSAFQVIRRKSRLDHYGASVAAIKLLAVAVPSVVARFFTSAI